MTTPYTYLIGWSAQNKWYYGVRYANRCHPSDLWKSYFTSSKHVKEFRKNYGEPDVIEIRKNFLDKKTACIWEEKVLKRMKVLHDDRWLNRNISGAIINDEATIARITERKKRENLPIEQRLAVSKALKSYNKSLDSEYKSVRGKNAASKFWEKYHTDEATRKKLSEKRKSQINPMQGKKQKRASCIRCRKDLPVNQIKTHQCK